MKNFIIIIEKDYKKWLEREELQKFFPDHRIISHDSALNSARLFLQAEIGHLSHITIKIEQDIIILSTEDQRFVDSIQSIARLCVNKMNYSGFYKSQEITIY